MFKKKFTPTSLQKKFNFKLTAKIAVFLLLFSSNFTFAQVPGFEDDVNDETGPAAPIDTSILLFSVAGAAMGIYFIKRNQKSIYTNKLK